MKKFIFFLFGFSVISSFPLESGWIKTYGGAYNEEAYAIIQTIDFGYIIGGYTDSYGAGFFDAYLVKIDNDGDMVWTRTFGGSLFDYAYSVTQNTNGEFLAAGETNSFGSGNFDIYIVKTDSLGDSIWTRTFGGSNVDRAKTVLPIGLGDYLIVGGTSSTGSGELDLCVLKISDNGDSIWWKNYGGSLNDFGFSIYPTIDNCFIICGYTESAGAGQKDLYLVKIDTAGDTLWTRTFGGGDDDFGYSVCQTQDKGFIICGHSASFGNGDIDVYLVKTDSTGDSVWAKTYGGIYCDFGQSVHQTSDNGYLIAGYTDSYGVGGYDVFMIRTDSAGDTLWTRTYGETNMDVARSSQLTSDGGFILAGSTNSLGGSGYDMYLIKTNSSGVSTGEVVVCYPDVYHLVAIGNKQVKLEFSLTGQQSVSVDIFDLVGRCISTPLTGNYSPGNHQYIINMERRGLYFYSVSGQKLIQAGKIIVY